MSLTKIIVLPLFRFMYKNDGNFALIFIHEDSFVVPFPKMTPFFWNNVCVAYNSGTRQAIAYINGELRANPILNKKLTKEKFEPDFIKNLILGQAIKYKNDNHVLKGKISQLNIWSVSVPSSQMERFTRLGSADIFLVEPDVLNWNLVTFNLGDLVNEGQVEKDDLNVEEKYVWLPLKLKMVQSEALSVCEKIGGRLPHARTAKDREAMFLFARDYFGKGAYYHLPIRKDSQEIPRNIYDKSEQINPNWTRGQPNGGLNQRTVVAAVSLNGSLLDVDDGYGAFSICKTPQQVHYYLQGDIGSTGIDRVYQLRYDSTSERHYFHGFIGTFIKVVNGFWTIEHRGEQLVSLSEEIICPFGKSIWKGGAADRMTLKLSHCDEDSFTCNSGICTNLTTACDQFHDCDDKSDEMPDICMVLQDVSGTYIASQPPASKSETLEVLVDFEIMRILEIKELEEMFTIKFELSLTWFDDRLTFWNLRNLTDRNVLTKSDTETIWVPRVQFSNTDHHGMLNLEDPRMSVARLGGALRTPMEELKDSLRYSGKDNPIIFKKIQAQSFICEFALRSYPFDTQNCTVHLELLPELKNLVEISRGDLGAFYTGPKELTQYTIKEVLMNDFDLGSISVSVSLQRNFVYHLATTYVPTLCLVIVVLLSLFIPEHRFEATIMLSLTSMLVMYTLYQSVADALPKTSYLKLVDIWLLFCLVLPFIVFVVLIKWELQQNNVYPLKKTTPSNMFGVDKTLDMDDTKKRKAVVISVLISVTVFFILGYVAIVCLCYFGLLQLH